MFRRIVTGAIACALVVLGVPLGGGHADAVGAANGTFALTALGATYFQDFNSLSSSTASNVLPTGWALDEQGSATANNGFYNFGTGSSGTGDTYSFGAASSTERAFGTLFSSSLTPMIGANFRNDTGGPITHIDISYTGEQWRFGANNRGPDRLDFQYSTTATGLATLLGWIDVDGLDFTSPRSCAVASCVGLTVGPLDGNSSANRVALSATITVDLPVGAALWIRWKDIDIAPGSDDGLAIDDFSLTPRNQDVAPSVVSTNPAGGATNVAVNANITIGFSEPVTLMAGWYTIACGATGTHAATQSIGGPAPNVYVLDPITDFGSNETCTVTVDATKVSDNDGLPPANMSANYGFSFTTVTATDSAPTVSFTSPANGGTDVSVNATVTIGFSEPVTLAAGWSTIACASTGTHPATETSGGTNVYILDPTTDFGFSETCTVTVDATKVSDNDGLPPANMAANSVFRFTTASNVCLAPATAIHTVQGSGLTSPMVGATVTVQGVVVGDYQTPSQFGGFYLEEEDTDWDADPATSEGIFVFSTTAVSAGDVVRLTGNVTELVSGTSSLTELTGVSGVTVCASGAAVTPTEIALPVANLSDFERYEGMLVHFSQTLTATETFTLGRFGEVRLAAGGRLYTPTAVVTPGANAAVKEDENQRRSFVLDDGNGLQNIDPTINPAGGLSATNTLRSGYTVTGLSGVFDQRFSAYRLQPFAGVAFSPTNPRGAAPTGTGNLKVASSNVLNFFNGDGLGGGFPTARGANTSVEYGRQKAKEVSALQQLDADIVGLMEMENDARPNSAIEDLVASLNLAVGANMYAFIDTGVIGTDAIRVALIYKPAKVTPIGSFATLTSAIDPAFIDTKNRPSLAQTFRLASTGGKLTVVVNHFKSKGSDCNDVGDPDIGDGQGNCNVTRRNAASALLRWLQTDPTGSGDPDFLLIGDMNSYTFEDPITTFTNGGLTNLVRTYGGTEAYSYVFNGESGYLDHALATAGLAAQVRGASDWHINADEPTVLDYNVEFKTANQVNTFYDAGPYRASDHDPVLVFLQLVDSVAPRITSSPIDVTVATGRTSASCGTIVDDAALGAVTATDDSGLAPSITRSGVPTGNVFPVGTTSITYTATDLSGNSVTVVQQVTVLDDAPPAIAAPAAVYAGTGPGATTPSILISDSSLGAATASDNCPGVEVTRSGVPAGNVFPLGATTITYTATDTSGNSSTATQLVTVVDDTPPTISGAPTTSPNANGWYSSGVTVHFTCTDNVAYIACGPDRTLSDDGSAQSVTGSAADAAGNTASATVGGINIDSTAPTIAGTTPGYTPGLWTHADVTVVFSCADALSGVDTCTAPITVSAEGDAQHASGTAVDKAGNSASATVDAIRIDKTAPTILLSGPLTYTIDQTLAITCAASDTLSGVVTVSCPGLSGPAVAAGLGSHTFTSGATDRAGNVGTATVTYTVSVTYTSLCALTRTYTVGEGIANSLCRKLDAADAAAARGSITNNLGAYIHEVEAQRGKAISTSDADVLIALARAL
ncbi:MAG: ExeM/NucH family extracellular endonuclease [Chloroflexota bacterium]